MQYYFSVNLIVSYCQTSKEAGHCVQKRSDKEGLTHEFICVCSCSRDAQLEGHTFRRAPLVTGKNIASKMPSNLDKSSRHFGPVKVGASDYWPS